MRDGANNENLNELSPEPNQVQYRKKYLVRNG